MIDDGSDWAKAAVAAVLDFDQARLDACLAPLSAEQLSDMASLFQRVGAETAGAFDSLLYRAAAVMCDELIAKRMLTGFDANGGFDGI